MGDWNLPPSLTSTGVRRETGDSRFPRRLPSSGLCGWAGGGRVSGTVKQRCTGLEGVGRRKNKSPGSHPKLPALQEGTLAGLSLDTGTGTEGQRSSLCCPMRPLDRP